MKRYLKSKLRDVLPSTLRRFDPQQRTAIIRAAISDANLVRSLSRPEQIELFIECARAIGVEAYLHTGQLGTFCGAVSDETVHRRYVRSGNWSPVLQEILVDHVFADRVGTYVDVGANIGLTLIPIARLGGIKCIGVEPEPGNFRFLRVNCLLNGVEDRVQLLNFAALSKNGKVEMVLSHSNFGDHRIRGVSRGSAGEPVDSGRRIVPVSAAPLDELIDKSSISHPFVCKVDTQGAEVEVLRGSTGLLDHVDMLVLEYWPFGLTRLGNNSKDLIDLLRGFSFGAIGAFDSADAKLGAVCAPAGEVLDDALRLGERAKQDDYWDLVLTRSPIQMAPRR